MSHFIIRHADSARLVYTTTFATRDDAEQAAQFVIKDGSFAIETLEEYGESAEQFRTRSNFALANYETLKQQVTDFLQEGIDGSLDADSFIEDHEDLINAVDFDLTEQRAFEVTLVCIARVKRGVDLTEIPLEASLDTWGNSGVDDIQIDAVYVHKQ